MAVAVGPLGTERVWADAPKEAAAGGWEKHTLVVGGKFTHTLSVVSEIDSVVR